ncbi:MAG: ArsR/SmtB family transcription factor [Anaerolineae bacterium]
MDDHTARSMARTFRALADPTRVRILDTLSEKEESVGALALRLNMTPSAVSHQLRLLRRMRLVRRRRQGKRVLYALDDDHIRDLFRVAREHVLEIRNEFPV